MGKFGEVFDLLHEVAPGKHFYQFYKDKGDLLKALLPYWRAGVEKRNFCFWAVPVFMTVQEACCSLAEEIPHFGDLISEGNFEIVSHVEWYGDGETFDGDLVLQKYEKKIEEALRKGFSVVRIAGDASGFKPHLWPLIRDYEQKVHLRVSKAPCIILCSFPLHELSLQGTKDVLDCHHEALIPRI